MNTTRRTLALLSLLFGSCAVIYAQRATEVVKWNATVSKSTAASASVVLSATIQDGWHVYALSQPAGGPTPLKITIPSGAPFALQAPVAETKVTRREDPSFKMETVYYLNSVNLTVNVKKEVNPAAEILPVDVRFKACNARLCLPPYTAHLTRSQEEMTTMPAGSMPHYFWLSLGVGAHSLLTNNRTTKTSNAAGTGSIVALEVEK
jgi:DsbC/DsbD-like thiol-disulfide interchange protein